MNTLNILDQIHVKYQMFRMFTLSFLWFCTLIHCPDPKFGLSPIIIELLIRWYPSNIFLSNAMLAPPSASLKFVISAVVARVFALYFRFLYPKWKFRIHVCVKSAWLYIFSYLWIHNALSRFIESILFFNYLWIQTRWWLSY